MTEQLYSEALYRAIQNGTSIEKALTRLKKVLEERGHAGLYPRALALAKTRFESDARMRTVEAIFASKKEQKAYEGVVADFVAKVGADDVVVREDDSIIGGYVLRGGGVEHDRSHKNALLTVYRTLIA